MAGQPIVVDGSNVAHEEASSEGKPRISNLVAMHRALEEEGYEPTTIVDATLRHVIDDPDQLEALFEAGRIHQAPAGTAADGFVLQQADEVGCRVVSNDTFEPYRDRYGWIEDRRLPYMIIDGKVLLHREPPAGESR